MTSDTVTFGQACCRLEWIYRGELYHPSGFNHIDEWSNPWSVPFNVFFVERGRIEIHAGHRHIKCAKGDCFLGAPGYRRHRMASRTYLLSVGFRLTTPKGRDITVNGLNRRLGPTRTATLHRRSVRLFNLVHPGRKSVDWYQNQHQSRIPDLPVAARQAEALLGWLCAWLKLVNIPGDIPSTPKPADGRVSAVIAVLQHSPLDQKLPKEPICHSTGLSWRRVEQIFDTQLHSTPAAYFEQLRLAHARERLAHTRLMLKEIAFELGFRHPAHFTAWFHNLAGQTPGVYRAQNVTPWTS
jgi:AraC-like DNA-binding protein